MLERKKKSKIKQSHILGGLENEKKEPLWVMKNKKNKKNSNEKIKKIVILFERESTLRLYRWLFLLRVQSIFAKFRSH